MSRMAGLERVRPDHAAREVSTTRRPPPPPPAVLAAGNQAVARMLARYGVADAMGAIQGGVETLTHLATGEIGGSVGRKGKNDPVDVAIVRSLLNAAGFADPDIDTAIERYQREKLGWHLADARIDPGGKTIRSLRGHGGAAHPAAANGHGPAAHGAPAHAPAPAHEPAPAPAPAPHAAEPAPGPVPAAPEPAPAPAPAPTPDLPEGPSEQVFRDFAAARQPLYAAMHAAGDDVARREATKVLRDFDAKHLPRLRALQQAAGGRWEIGDAGARDAVLGAIQLEAATDAMGDLLADSEKVHKRVADASGMGLDSAWCGMFTVDHFRHSGMDKDLAAGFLHVDNVHDFFTYRHNRNPKRVPKWIWAEHQWHDLAGYHEERGSKREWLDGSEVWKGGDLDIRPGDVVLIDHNADGKADHIVKVQSYDPSTSTLLTIGGNDAGFVIDKNPKHNAKADPKRERAETAADDKALGKEAWHGGAGGGHVGLSVHNVTADGKKRGTIFGVGRPSLVDFEDHPYDKGNNLKKPPPALKE
jgi:hypothetical protein